MSVSYPLNVVGVSTGGNTGGNTGTNVGTYVFIGSNNITLSQSTGANFIHSLYISGAAAGAGGSFSAGASNIGNTSGSTGTVSNQIVFAGGNNITLSQSTAAGGATLTISAANQTAFVLSNSNNVSFGTNGSTVTASASFVAQTQFVLSASNGLAWGTNGSTVTGSYSQYQFSASNGLAFGSNGSTVTGSYTVPTVTNSSWSVSDAATSGTVGRLAFTNINGVTLSLSSGTGGSHTIVGSHNGLTSQSNQAFSAAGGASNFQTLIFGDTNGVSFTNTNGSVGIASVKLSMYAVSNTTQGSSGSANHTALSFGGAGAISVGVTGGSVVISGNAAAGDGVNIIAAGTQTANTTGTIVFSNSNGISFGLSNSSIVTAKMPSVSYYEPFAFLTGQNAMSGTLALQPVLVPFQISATQARYVLHISNSTNAGGTHSASFGVYTMSGSTANLASSGSMSAGYNSTAANSSYTAVSGTRYWSADIGTWNLTPGHYLMGMWLGWATSGTSNTFSVWCRTAVSINAAPFAGNYNAFGMGIYGTSFVSAMPSTIHVTDIAQSGGSANRQPWYAFFGTH